MLATLTAALTAVAGAIAGIPIVGSLISPALRKTQKAGADWMFVGELHDFAPNVPKRVEIVEKTVDAWTAHPQTVLGAVWLVRRPEGHVDAFSSVCPHLGCSINHEQSAFRCPCHTSAFRLDGTVAGGPSPRSMDLLPVQVKEKRVFVRYARFKQGTPQREEI
jgi:menaquinol-cytochrome c reductase iron-sulfur subunit